MSATLRKRLAALEAQKQTPDIGGAAFRVTFAENELRADSAQIALPGGGWREATPDELAEINAEFTRLDESI